MLKDPEILPVGPADQLVTKDGVTVFAQMRIKICQVIEKGLFSLATGFFLGDKISIYKTS